jgi:hypothetical protein
VPNGTYLDAVSGQTRSGGRGRPAPGRSAYSCPILRRIRTGYRRAMPGYPRPIGAVPMLGPLNGKELPDGPDRAAANPAAEVLYLDQSWRPARALAWRQIQGGWAIRLRWPDRTEHWRLCDGRFIRPDRGSFA